MRYFQSFERQFVKVFSQLANNITSQIPNADFRKNAAVGGIVLLGARRSIREPHGVAFDRGHATWKFKPLISTTAGLISNPSEFLFRQQFPDKKTRKAEPVNVVIVIKLANRSSSLSE